MWISKTTTATTTNRVKLYTIDIVNSWWVGKPVSDKMQSKKKCSGKQTKTTVKEKKSN